MSDARASAQSGTSYNSGDTKYNMQNYTYPMDLFTSAKSYGGNWVMINVNVLEQSKFMVSSEVLDNVSVDRRQTGFAGNTMSGAEAAAAIAAGAGVVGAAGAAVGAILNGGVTNVLTSIGSGAGFGKAINSLASTIGGGALASVALVGTAAAVPLLNEDVRMNRPVKRVKAAIQLPMPNSMITPYSVDWSADSTKLMDLSLRVGPEMIEMTKHAFKGNLDLAMQEGSKMLKTGTDAMTSTVMEQSPGLSAATGIASNPKKEMIFQGVDFRNFQMDYTFYPKNNAEAMNVKRIINLLKFHMYPEYKSSERFTFIYPSEFDITFMSGSTENPWVNKIATCVLQGMNVNYTPTSQWAAHADGSPVMINITLQFKELSIITKENLVNPDSESGALLPNY